MESFHTGRYHIQRTKSKKRNYSEKWKPFQTKRKGNGKYKAVDISKTLSTRKKSNRRCKNRSSQETTKETLIMCSDITDSQSGNEQYPI